MEQRKLCYQFPSLGIIKRIKSFGAALDSIIAGLRTNPARLGILLLYLLHAVSRPPEHPPSPHKEFAASRLHRLKSADRNRLVRDF